MCVCMYVCAYVCLDERRRERESVCNRYDCINVFMYIMQSLRETFA